MVHDEPERPPAALLDEALAVHVDGRLAEAAELYERVLAAEPANAFAHYNLGLIAQTQGRVDEAEQRYWQALAADPRHEPALFNLAVLRAEAGDHGGAVDLYRLVVAIDAANATAHLNLGFSLRAAGMEREAQGELDRAVELDPRLAARIP